MSSLGGRFRAAREARGLTLSEVAEQIRIRSVYLAAIEEENWASIGAPVYTRGFMRTYARFLGIEAEEIVAAFNAEQGEPPSAQASESRNSSGKPRSSREHSLGALLWIAGAIAFLLIGLVGYNLVVGRQAPSAPEPTLALASPSPLLSPAPSSPLPAGSTSPLPGGTSSPPGISPSAGPSAPPGTPGPHAIEVSLDATSWLRLVVDGSDKMVGVFPAGTDRFFNGHVAVLRIGNAGGVSVTVDGKSLGKLGGSGVVVERTFTL